MSLRIIYKYIIFLLLGAIFNGCSPFRHMPENSYLLDNVDIKMEKRYGLKEELYQNITQKPNKKFLGLKFHMFLYNLSNPKKEKGYFKKIGEEPVVWDPYQTKKSSNDLLLYLKQNGYFRSNVQDSIFYKGKRKVDIKYYVNPGKPYKINNFTYKIYDPGINNIVKNDSANNLIKIGERFKISELISEKKRIRALLLNNGYYDFMDDDIKNYIAYKVDTSLDRQVNIIMTINNPDLNKDGNDKFYQYRINDVYIFRNYQPIEFLNNPDYLKKDVDTINYDRIYFLSKEDVKTRPGILSQSNYILPGELYSQQNENLSIKHIRLLGIFKNVEVDFKRIEDTINSNKEKLMNCYINLIPSIRQFWQYDIAATNSSGNIGAEASIKYQYKNLFGNAEVLDVIIRGAAETFFREDPGNTIGNSNTFGVETKFHIPKFLIPIKTENFIKKYSPRTTTSLSYKYFERESFYNKNFVNISFGYNWRGNRYTTHSVDPVNLNFVYINIKDTTRFNDLANTNNVYMFENFQDKMITTANYSFEYNNEVKKNIRDFIYLRFNLELGGNILYGYNKIFNKDTETYKIFNVPFSQFIKTDIDFRYYNVKSSAQSMVYRVFIGVAKPYGNSVSVPYEKRYFCGGPNGMRAWNSYYLGPGETYDTTRYRFNGSSDIKLEFNVEYRFDIFWKLEGALFMDAGNIWTLSLDQKGDDPEQEKRTELNITQLGVGTGFGIRLDFEYFIARVDWALKMRDPSKYNGTADYEWIFRKDKIYREDGALQIGITYPF